MACVPAPSTISVRSRSPPNVPPVGFRIIIYAEPSARLDGSNACNGSAKRRPIRTVRPSRRSNTRRRNPSRPTRSGLEQQLTLDPIDNTVDACSLAQVGENERPLAARDTRVALHHAKIRSDIGSKIDFVDYQQARSHDSRPALARNLVAFGDVDHVDSRVPHLGAESRRKIVPATLDDHDSQIGEAPRQLVQRLEIHRGIFADRGMRTSPRLHAEDSLRGQHSPPGKKLRV